MLAKENREENPCQLHILEKPTDLLDHFKLIKSTHAVSIVFFKLDVL